MGLAALLLIASTYSLINERIEEIKAENSSLIRLVDSLTDQQRNTADTILKKLDKVNADNNALLEEVMSIKQLLVAATTPTEAQLRMKEKCDRIKEGLRRGQYGDYISAYQGVEMEMQREGK